MSKTIEKLFENNWDQIKSGLKTIWRDLTLQDFKQIEGSYDIFIGKIKKAYGLTKDEINDQLSDFFDAEGINSTKNKILDSKEKGEDSSTIKSMIENYVEQYLQSIKEKTLHFKENVIQYAKDNPVKILGLAAVASFTISKILNPSK